MLEKIFKQAILRANKLPRPFLRPLTLPVLLLVLNGCAALSIPPAFSIASYAVDGFSYLNSGKSLTDHAISDAAGRDCATWRIFKGRAICRDFTPKQLAERKRRRGEIRYDDDRAYIATNLDGIPTDGGGDTTGFAAKPRGAAKPKAQPRVQPKSAGAAHAPVTVQRETLAPQPKRPKVRGAPVAARHAPQRPAAAAAVNLADKRYVVFGSFRVRSDAERFARRHAAVRPTVVATLVKGQRRYRVVVRPGGQAALASAIRTLRRAGVRDAYTMRVCTADRRASHCMPPLAAGKAAGRRTRRSSGSGPTGG